VPFRGTCHQVNWARRVRRSGLERRPSYYGPEANAKRERVRKAVEGGPGRAGSRPAGLPRREAKGFESRLTGFGLESGL